MKRLVILSGYSGAGKDFAAARAAQWTPSRWRCSGASTCSIKFASEGKRSLETILKIPNGSLDDREFRQQIAPHCQGRTYLEVLIDYFHHRDAVIGRDLFPARTIEALADSFYLHGIDTVFITDMRSPSELEHLLAFLNNHPDIRVYPIWVHSDKARQLSSDKESYALMGAFPSRRGVLNSYNTDYYQSLRTAVKGIDNDYNKQKEEGSFSEKIGRDGVPANHCLYP